MPELRYEFRVRGIELETTPWISSVDANGRARKDETSRRSLINQLPKPTLGLPMMATLTTFLKSSGSMEMRLNMALLDTGDDMGTKSLKTQSVEWCLVWIPLPSR